VDVYYIHIPVDPNPIKDVLEGIDALYRAGKFKRFGLSNFSAEQVEEVVSVAQAHGWVLPTVYQGNYNAVARRTETELMPVLRKYDMAFYAYSPIAGGFLTKTPAQLVNQGGQGRWDKDSYSGKIYHALYNKPGMIKALGKFGEIAQDAGISQAELAYRWVAYNSKLRDESGDAVVIGSRYGPQLTETLAALKKGPLSPQIAAGVDALWEWVEEESPLDNHNG
jgi:aflatoxin B1 aldehyde reductase